MICINAGRNAERTHTQAIDGSEDEKERDFEQAVAEDEWGTMNSVVPNVHVPKPEVSSVNTILYHEAHCYLFFKQIV